jgi:metal-dependent amidase/aminoacylase/carboxypeptidase family protein
MPAWLHRDLPQNLVQDFTEFKVITGETDIDDSAQTESTAYSILTIAADAYNSVEDVEVQIDLAKATTGFAAVESSATIVIAVARKVDGTNYRREAAVEAALSGTNAAGRMQKVPVGKIAAGETVAIYITMSADATSDMELPYKVIYRGLVAPTVTPVAAG